MEADVYVWCYALLVVHARKEEEEEDNFHNPSYLMGPIQSDVTQNPVTFQLLYHAVVNIAVVNNFNVYCGVRWTTFLKKGVSS